MYINFRQSLFILRELVFFTRETKQLPVCFTAQHIPSEKRSALKGKNLLLREQIVSF